MMREVFIGVMMGLAIAMFVVCVFESARIVLWLLFPQISGLHEDGDALRSLIVVVFSNMGANALFSKIDEMEAKR